MAHVSLCTMLTSLKAPSIVLYNGTCNVNAGSFTFRLGGTDVAMYVYLYNLLFRVQIQLFTKETIRINKFRKRRETRHTPDIRSLFLHKHYLLSDSKFNPLSTSMGDIVTVAYRGIKYHGDIDTLKLLAHPIIKNHIYIKDGYLKILYAGRNII